jgi:hypothetical protein
VASIQADLPMVPEGDFADVSVRLTLPQTVTVAIATTGSAIDADGEPYDDVDDVPAQVSFLASTEEHFAVLTIDDELDEPGPELVTLTLLPGADYNIDPQSSSVTFEIHDNDSSPPGWVPADIGPVGYSGGSMESGGTFTLVGAGQDVGGTSDGFHYLHRGRIAGDFDLVARVVSLTSHDPVHGSKAGLMVRGNLVPESRNTSLFMYPNGDIVWQWRSGDQMATDWAEGSLGMSAPFLKIEKRGDTFTAYESQNGDPAYWNQVGEQQTYLPGGDVYVGLFVTSMDTGELVVAQFSDVSLDMLGGDVQITTETLPDATVNQFYDITLQAVGGSLPYTWDIPSGGAPEGLNMGDDGRIQGWPGMEGLYNFTVHVTDAESSTDSQDLSLRVNENTICGTGEFNCEGICVNLSEDPENCGVCGRVCNLPHATATCRGATCVVDRCEAGRGDCNLKGEDGCETVLSTSGKCVEGGVAYEHLGCSSGASRDKAPWMPAFALAFISGILWRRRRRL